MPKPRKQVKATDVDGIAVHCAYAGLQAIERLKANPANPNSHTVAQIHRLAKLIKHRGVRRAAVVSKTSGYLVTGHGGVAAGRLLGMQRYPVDYQEFASEKDEWAHMIADNERFGDDDKAILRELGEQLDDGAFDMELTGRDDWESLMTSIVPPRKPDVKFSEFIGEENQYVVLVFKRDIDWLSAKQHFQLETVGAKGSKGKQIKRGIARVIDGAEYLSRIKQ